MRNRILLTDEQKARVDASILDAITSGLSANAELATYLHDALGKDLPTRPRLEYVQYVDASIRRLREARKILPKYTTPRGAARGGWRAA